MALLGQDDLTYTEEKLAKKIGCKLDINSNCVIPSHSSEVSHMDILTVVFSDDLQS